MSDETFAAAVKASKTKKTAPAEKKPAAAMPATKAPAAPAKTAEKPAKAPAAAPAPKPAPAAKPAAKAPAKPAPAAPAVKVEVPTMSSRAREMILEGKLTEEEMFAVLKVEFPAKKPQKDHFSWHRARLVEKGLLKA